MLFALFFDLVRRFIAKPGFVCILIFSLPVSASASHAVSLAWDPSTATDVAGYVVHYGTQSGVYINSLDVGKVTSASITLPDDGNTYYFAASTYDSYGVGSDYSNETSFATSAGTTDALTNTGFVGGRFGFDVQGTAGTQYVIQASTDLVAWVSVQTNTAPFVFVDDESTSYDRRFYRAIPL